MTKKITPAQRAAKDLREYKAMDIMTLAKAHEDMLKTGSDRYMASGLIITITNINGTGETVVGPVMIKDGLSADTIAALRADIKATYDLRLAMNKLKS